MSRQPINWRASKRVACWGMILSLALCGSAQGRLFDVDDVKECVALNIPQGDFAHLSDIEVRDTSGKTRRMQARVQARQAPGQLLLNIRLLSPGNLAGTTALVRERSKKRDDIRLYIPALERTRYISDAMSTTKLFDTDFSYADIKQLYGQFVDGDTHYLGIEQWEGRPVHILQLSASETEALPYERLITRIDTESCVILAMDFLDSEGQAQRQLRTEAKSIQTIDIYQVPTRYRMTDLQHGSSTQIDIHQVKIDSKLPAWAFNSDQFYLDAPIQTQEPSPPEEALGDTEQSSDGP